MYTKILVPLDGSDLSNAVLAHVRRVARCSQARVVLLHVLPEPARVVNGLSMAMLERQQVAGQHGGRLAVPGQAERDIPHTAWRPLAADLVEREIEAYKFLDGVAAELARFGVEARTRVLIAEPAEAILDVAAEENADLIAMATHGRGGIRRFLLGSVADRVVRHANAPVLLVRSIGSRIESPQELAGYERILVPLDGSELANTVLPYARGLAVCTSAAVTLLQVVPQPEGGPADDLTAWVERGAEFAKDHLNAVASVLAESGVQVEVRVVVGRPADAILDTADDCGADLIAMATHGYGGIRRFLMGSVADRVMRHARVPVLLVRPHP